MANSAIIDEIGMVNIGRYPRRCGMAVIALLRGNDMRWRFAAGGHIVVTTGTGANDLCVIHGTRRDRRPQFRRNAVTRIALVGRADMICRFTRCDNTIVTTDARPGQLRMIHGSRRHSSPWRGTRRMTGIALIRAWDMRGPFA